MPVVAWENEALYERAQSLIRRTEGKKFPDTVSPKWFPDNRSLWNRVTTETASAALTGG